MTPGMQLFRQGLRILHISGPARVHLASGQRRWPQARRGGRYRRPVKQLRTSPFLVGLDGARSPAAIASVSRAHSSSAVAMGEVGVPASIQKSVLERIGSVGHETEDLLRAAAVSGYPFYPAAVAGLVGINVTEAAG